MKTYIDLDIVLRRLGPIDHNNNTIDNTLPMFNEYLAFKKENNEDFTEKQDILRTVLCHISLITSENHRMVRQNNAYLHIGSFKTHNSTIGGEN